MPIRRIALVSHNYNIVDRNGRWDFSSYMASINQVADREGCDSVLYALYTWDLGSGKRPDYDAVFDSLQHLEFVVLETGNLERDGRDGSQLVVEVWMRGNRDPQRVKQVFARSVQLDAVRGRVFVQGLPGRRVGDAVLLSCGETNIVGVHRRPPGSFSDPFGAIPALHALAPVILNPVHDYMTRYEMRMKRRILSRDGHTVISVWNQGKRKGEARLPWTVFRDGEELTASVTELPRLIPERPDVRIGIFDL